MKEMNKNESEDIKIRKLLADTKINAGENLKFRIMQQLETEQALSRRKAKSSFSAIGSMISVFGTMYILIAIIGAGIYFYSGAETLKSATGIMVVVLIASVFSVFWFLTMYDEKRRQKKRK